jgi:cytochrome c-type biogenesis protein
LEIGDQRIEPVSAEGPEWVEHHRTTIIRFPKQDANGNSLITEDSTDLLLKLEHPWDRYNYDETGEANIIESSWIWELPLDIPEELKSRDTFTNAMVFSLSAGLLSSVLTPCLIQLVLVFFATLGGMSAKEVMAAKGVTPEVRRRVMLAATLFVLGYVTLFVVSGALIGYAGKEAQLFFANYTRPVGIIAGVIVIMFGLWVGIRSQAPLVCKLPGAEMIQNMQGRGMIGTVVVSIAFSLGCMSCFGGAIIGTLFIYIGALGSASVGATVMGIFAAGVAVPFLLSAVFFSRMQNLFEFVARHHRYVGALSTATIVIFGLMLVTDNFHTVSDMIYPYLGLD